MNKKKPKRKKKGKREKRKKGERSRAKLLIFIVFPQVMAFRWRFGDIVVNFCELSAFWI